MICLHDNNSREVTFHKTNIKRVRKFNICNILAVMGFMTFIGLGLNEAQILIYDRS